MREASIVFFTFYWLDYVQCVTNS